MKIYSFNQLRHASARFPDNQLGLKGMIDGRVTVYHIKSDLESLLVGFLNEILFWIQTESIACEHCELSIKDTSLSGIVHCASIDGLTKEIKAVTYHNLRIIRSEQGYETTIVFDV